MIGEGDAPLGFDEAGVVASTSSRLATADPPISIFYLSAFSYDYVFVPQEVSERALEALLPLGETRQRKSARLVEEIQASATEAESDS